MNLPGLMAFVETAATGSLTAAAARLELTPAAVSKSLARLEAQLGVRLLQRSTRRLALTAEGETFLAKARAGLQLLDEAAADLAQAAAAPAGRVRVSVGAGFGRRWVLPALPAITAAHPKLAIDVDLDNRPVDLVGAGYDIGIRGGFIADSSWVARRVCALPVGLFASPAYLRRAGVPRSPEDLAAHATAASRLAATPPVWRFTDPPSEWPPTAAITADDPDAMIELALAGAGIVQAGLHHALPYLRSGRLKLVLAGRHDPGTREIVVHVPHRLYLAPRVRTVVDALLAHFARCDDLHVGIADVVRTLPDAVATPPAGAGTPADRPATPRARARSPRR